MARKNGFGKHLIGVALGAISTAIQLFQDDRALLIHFVRGEGGIDQDIGQNVKTDVEILRATTT